MFGFFSIIYNEILYRPLLNALFLFYQYLPGHDFGVAIIVLTILIKVLLYPLGISAIKYQKGLSELQPEIQKIQKQYKDDKEKQGLRLMQLYKEKGVNPFSGCLPLLAQLPILIALYQVFGKGLSLAATDSLYGFVPRLNEVNTVFLGIIDLSKSFIIKTGGQEIYYWPVFILAVLTGVSQYVQTKMVSPAAKKTNGGAPDFSQMMQTQTLYLFPILTVLIILGFPSAIALYWLVSNLFSIFQQYFIFKKA